MHTDTHASNSAPRYEMPTNVAREILSRTLVAMGEPAQVSPGTKEYHQAEAMRAARMVGHQYTKEAKKAAKRECLGHLIASLAEVKA